MPNMPLPGTRLDDAALPPAQAAIEQYTYVDYLEAWYDRFGQAENGATDVEVAGRMTHVTLWALSPTQFENSKAKLLRLYATLHGELLPGVREATQMSIYFAEAHLLL